MTNNALAAALVAILVVLPTAPAGAQTEPAKPAAGMKLEQGKPAGAGGEARPMKTAAATGKRPMRVNEDARHCLEQPGIAEIVKCAEPYRY